MATRFFSMNLSLRDIWEIYLLALCIWREAADQPPDAQIAVACSIRNRTLTAKWWNGGKANDYIAVILFPYQFSSFNPTDPNVVKLPGTADPVFMQCLQIAENVHTDGLQADTVQGATSYYSGSTVPSWAAEMSYVSTIGAFKFYR